MSEEKGEMDTIAPRTPLVGAGPGHGFAGSGPAMTGTGIAGTASATAGTNLLFLREEEIRLAQDLMFFAYRDFTNAADEVLEGLGLGRAHHRALHYIGRNPAITVSDLLAILRITKQSLARVLSVLIEQDYVSQAPGPVDRRQRLLTLTANGHALERQLFERQRDRLAAAYRDAGGAAIEGFRRVMRGIMNESARNYIDDADAAVRHSRGPAIRPERE
jgi:DNA-binding MarR family transcriptional regulator